MWKRPNKNTKEKADNLVLAAALCGHSDEVCSVVASQEWSIVVSGTKNNRNIQVYVYINFAKTSMSESFPPRSCSLSSLLNCY